MSFRKSLEMQWEPEWRWDEIVGPVPKIVFTFTFITQLEIFKMTDLLLLTFIVGPYILMFIIMFIIHVLTGKPRHDFDEVTFDDKHIPYEELAFREEVNSMTLEEIDDLFSYEDVHSMVDDDFGQDHKKAEYKISYELFEDTIPFWIIILLAENKIMKFIIKTEEDWNNAMDYLEWLFTHRPIQCRL